LLRSVEDLRLEEWLLANRPPFSSFLTPPTCRFCKEVVARIDVVCPHCKKQDPLLYEERCSHSAKHVSLKASSIGIRKGDSSPERFFLRDIHNCMKAMDLETLHFALANAMEFYYRNREYYGIGPTERICQFLILIAPDVKVSMENTYGPDAPNPGHFGYHQLAIIRERQGDFLEAIRLCEEAISAGWSGDWYERIARIRSKLAKKAII